MVPLIKSRNEKKSVCGAGSGDAARSKWGPCAPLLSAGHGERGVKKPSKGPKVLF